MVELTTTLKSQTIQNQVRNVGVNENYWYPVAWSEQVPSGRVMPVTIWQKAIAIYRDRNTHLHALENACPHKGIELHLGEVQGDRVVCPYHGWEFDANGECVSIPYFPKTQKLPCANIRRYPIAEKYGIVWVFPGDPNLAGDRTIPEIPEYSDPNCLIIPITGHFRAHFSICNENTMDVFHGYLHKNLQGWFEPMLVNLQASEDSVYAAYQVSYQGWLSRFLGFGTENTGVTTRTVSVHYQYPHYHNSLEGLSSLYLMRLPVGPDETRSFSLLCLPHIRMPKWLQNLLKPVMVPLLRQFLFMRFLEQDIGMVESEQQTYRQNVNQRYVEVNPAIIALQRVIVKQYETFVQRSNSSDI